MIFNARLAPYRASPNVSGIADLIAVIPTHIATLKKKKKGRMAHLSAFNGVSCANRRRKAC